MAKYWPVELNFEYEGGFFRRCVGITLLDAIEAETRPADDTTPGAEKRIIYADSPENAMTAACNLFNTCCAFGETHEKEITIRLD